MYPLGCAGVDDVAVDGRLSSSSSSSFGCFGFGGGASFGGESVGIVYDCADDAVGVGDGARDARGRWGENILGDGFRGVGFGGLCLGG